MAELDAGRSYSARATRCTAWLSYDNCLSVSGAGKILPDSLCIFKPNKLMYMSKEEILAKWALLNDSLATWQKEDVYKCMQEFSDQEKEKVAVAFQEWKEDNYILRNGFYHFIRHKGAHPAPPYTLADLYQYFINNVYNK